MDLMEIILRQLGLQQYLTPLIGHGFDSWEVLMDISEGDLQQVGFKLGHRRQLQRAIRADRERSGIAPLDMSDGRVKSGAGDDGGLKTGKYQSCGTSRDNTHAKGRQLPADPNAPPLPKSEYALYALFLHQNKDVAGLLSVDIAQLTGELWQRLEPREQAIWIERAAGDKARYEMECAHYRKTENYQRYLQYLRRAGIRPERIEGRQTGSDESSETGISSSS